MRERDRAPGTSRTTAADPAKTTALRFAYHEVRSIPPCPVAPLKGRKSAGQSSRPGFSATLKPGRPCLFSDISRRPKYRCRSWALGRRWAWPVCNEPAICRSFQLGDSFLPCARPGRFPGVAGRCGVSVWISSFRIMRQDLPLNQINRNAIEEKELCRDIGHLEMSRPLGGKPVGIMHCPLDPPAKSRLGTEQNSPAGLFFNQDRLVLFEIFLHGRFATDGVGNSDSGRLGQLVMHKCFANESHPEIHFRHPPELTGFQWLQTNSGGCFGLSHTRGYDVILD